jgi:hypothetical protein
MNVSTTITAGVTVAETLALGSESGTTTGGVSLNLTLPSGAAAGQADLKYTKKDVTLAGGASLTLTLSALVDDLGRTIALTRVKVFALDNTASPEGTADLTISPGATQGWTAPWNGSTAPLIVHGGGFGLLAAPGAGAYPVAVGVTDRVTIANIGSAIATLDIVIVGASA